jgi:hypothetical protein
MNRRPSFERSRSTSSIDYNSLLRCPAEIEEEEQEETEEEKFVKRWPQILETGYRHVVLPPECKRVEKPRNAPKKEKKEEKKKSEEKKSNHDDDHPATRLINYTRQLVHLIMSFLRYDYVGAGWTLIHWVEACLRLRKSRTNPDEDDDVTDDESDAGSTALRRLSTSSQSSVYSPPKVSPRPKTRRDSILRRRRDEAKRDGGVGESNDSTEQPQLSLSIGTSMTNESEEKKESQADVGETSTFESPPHTPLSSNNMTRQDSPSSLYGTPNLEPRDVRDLDPGEILATKLALNSRLPPGVKMKDALEVRMRRSTKPKVLNKTNRTRRILQFKVTSSLTLFFFLTELSERHDTAASSASAAVTTNETTREYVFRDEFC